MNDEIRLRPANAEDEAFLVDLYASTREDELALTGWSEEQKMQFCRHQFEAQATHYQKHYPTAEYSVIERDGVAIGRLYVDRWMKELRIMDIALLPRHRAMGIGTLLLRGLQEEARTAGKTLSIHVEKFNPALLLYERLGFEQIKEHGIYLLMEWRGGD